MALRCSVMPFRWLMLIVLPLLIAVGCQKLSLLGDAQSAVPPVIVIPEPQIAVPVPLAPGEGLVVPPGSPFYLAPGVAPPPGLANVGPPGSAAAPTRPAPRGLLDRIGSGDSAISPWFGLPRPRVVENRLPNPIAVPVANAELAWDQIADVVSDFFPIAREQPVQLLDGVLTEGFIETAPQIGATILEPQRRDSVGAFNRWEATFQTIRRRAVLRVTPSGQGYAIGVQAFKEIENLSQPVGAATNPASLANNAALPNGRLDNDAPTVAPVGGWIPLGRDEPLEQALLARLQERLARGGVR